jgi:hypothetical protein
MHLQALLIYLGGFCRALFSGYDRPGIQIIHTCISNLIAFAAKETRQAPKLGRNKLKAEREWDAVIPACGKPLTSALGVLRF